METYFVQQANAKQKQTNLTAIRGNKGVFPIISALPSLWCQGICLHGSLEKETSSMARDCPPGNSLKPSK